MKRLNLGLTGLLMASLLVGCGLPTEMVAPQYGSQGKLSARAGAPANYYQAAQGQTGMALLVTLQSTVSKHKDLGYNGARNVMFGDLDDDLDNNVVDCVYTGMKVSGVKDSGTAFKDGSGLNTEHTWPQSLGATGPAKADLHHLFPSDVETNGARGSHPFGEVKQPTHAFPKLEVGGKQSILGINGKGKTVFEPRDEHKGDVARALFYFYTVYGYRGGADVSNFRVEEETLKKWHVLDPVDAAERKRNDGIYAVQGNRNPYVDHPEFVKAVGNFIN
ncbi:Extracellular ribonuclease precursor [compost metagenome]